MKIRIGTRKSKLALVQAEMLIGSLESLASPLVGEMEPITCELIPLVTSGDLKQTASEATPRDKADWIAEIEQALVAGEIDVAIHSGKDVPVEVHPETRLSSILERASPYDCYFSRQGTSGSGFLQSLPLGAVIGTSSLRRRAQLLSLRSDLEVVPYRGNVTTRLERFAADEQYAAIVLAQAGIDRLALGVTPSGVFSLAELVPAVAQGILAVQYRAADTALANLVGQLVRPEVEQAWQTERAVIAGLGADCRSAAGVYAERQGEVLHVVARVLSKDGAQRIDHSASGADPMQLGRLVATQLLELGAGELLR